MAINTSLKDSVTNLPTYSRNDCNLFVLWALGCPQQCYSYCTRTRWLSIIYWEISHSFVYPWEIRKHCEYLQGNWVCINIFHMSLILKFHINALCHSSSFSHTLRDVFVRRCSCQCLFHHMQGRGDGTTPSDSQAYSMTAGEEIQRGRKKTKKNKTENKKTPLLNSAKCISFTVRCCRFKLMGPDSIASKNALVQC